MQLVIGIDQITHNTQAQLCLTATHRSGSEGRERSKVCCSALFGVIRTKQHHADPDEPENLRETEHRAET
jgi:hypothetical protein